MTVVAKDARHAPTMSTNGRLSQSVNYCLVGRMVLFMHGLGMLIGT